MRCAALFGAALASARIILACHVTPAEHAANVGEASQYAAELTICREQAKADGGLPAYEACACAVDKRHSFDAGKGCP